MKIKVGSDVEVIRSDMVEGIEFFDENDQGTFSIRDNKNTNTLLISVPYTINIKPKYSNVVEIKNTKS